MFGVKKPSRSLAAIAEFSVVVLAASIRPLRYLLSPTYRAKVNTDYVGKSPLIKWAAIFGGTVLLCISSFIVYGAISLFQSASTQPKPQASTLKQRAVEAAASKALNIITKAASAAH